MKRPKISWSHLLPYVSCIGVVVTAIFASKAGAKVQKVLEEQNYIHNPNKVKDIFEESKLVWRNYILTTAAMALTIGSIIANKRLTKREMAALTMLGTASSKLLTDYKRAVREEVPDKYNDIVRRVTSYREHDVQIADPPPITMDGFCELITDNPYPGDDETLFYDELFDIWFRTSLAVVRTAQYHLNRNFILRGEVSMGEFYEFIGLDHPDEFNTIGWGQEFIDGGCSWIDFSTVLSDKIDGEKFFILSYTFAPENLNDYEV